jgi:hypothetical protein
LLGEPAGGAGVRRGAVAEMPAAVGRAAAEHNVPRVGNCPPTNNLKNEGERRGGKGAVGPRERQSNPGSLGAATTLKVWGKTQPGGKRLLTSQIGPTTRARRPWPRYAQRHTCHESRAPPPNHHTPRAQSGPSTGHTTTPLKFRTVPALSPSHTNIAIFLSLQGKAGKGRRKGARTFRGWLHQSRGSEAPGSSSAARAKTPTPRTPQTARARRRRS